MTTESEEQDSVVGFAPHEARMLQELVGQLSALLDESAPEPDGDPAIARLLPSPYPDDPEAAAEYRALTAADLLHRRGSDAQVVREDLDAAVAVAAPAQEQLLLRLTPTRRWAWMRTLTSLRLVLATRLDHDDRRPDRDGLAEVSDWLGYRLELLAADDSAP